MLKSWLFQFSLIFLFPAVVCRTTFGKQSITTSVTSPPFKTPAAFSASQIQFCRLGCLLNRNLIGAAVIQRIGEGKGPIGADHQIVAAIVSQHHLITGDRPETVPPIL